MMTTDTTEIKTCPCDAPRHGEMGCEEEAYPHPEDWEVKMPCRNCFGWEIAGVHLDEYPPVTFARLGA